MPQAPSGHPEAYASPRWAVGQPAAAVAARAGDRAVTESGWRQPSGPRKTVTPPPLPADPTSPHHRWVNALHRHRPPHRLWPASPSSVQSGNRARASPPAIVCAYVWSAAGARARAACPILFRRRRLYAGDGRCTEEGPRRWHAPPSAQTGPTPVTGGRGVAAAPACGPSRPPPSTSAGRARARTVVRGNASHAHKRAPTGIRDSCDQRAAEELVHEGTSRPPKRP